MKAWQAVNEAADKDEAKWKGERNTSENNWKMHSEFFYHMNLRLNMLWMEILALRSSY